MCRAVKKRVGSAARTKARRDMMRVVDVRRREREGMAGHKQVSSGLVVGRCCQSEGAAQG